MIVLKGNPLSTNNIYRRHGNFIYMSRAGKLLKEQYMWEATDQWSGGVLKGDVECSIKLYFGDRRKRDIDNYGKLLLDSLSGIVFSDDKQIQKMTVEKFYDKERPRICIEVKSFQNGG